MSSNKNTVLCKFPDGKFATISSNQVLLYDKDSLIEEEKKYKIKWGNDVAEVVVKLVGTKEHIEREFKKISEYSQTNKKKNDQKQRQSKKTDSVQHLIASSSHSSSSDCLVVDNNTERQLKERDEMIKGLKDQLDIQQQQQQQLKEELEGLRTIVENNNLDGLVKLSVCVLKYLATPNEREEIKLFGGSGGDEEVPISSKHLVKIKRITYNTVCLMIEDRERPSRILRTLLSSVLPDPKIWSERTGSQMLIDFNSHILACREFMTNKNSHIADSDFKQVLRHLCTEAKKKTRDQNNNNIEKTPNRSDHDDDD